jgi:hypothetical protein
MYDHERSDHRERHGRVDPPEPQADGYTEMEAYLKGRQLSYELAIMNGWYPAVFAGGLRLVIPATHGFWQARLIGGLGPRYVSSAKPRNGSIVVVNPGYRPLGTIIAEGPMDALAAAELGVLGIATMGVAPPREAIEACRRAAEPPVWLVLDSDTSRLAVAILGAIPLARVVTVYPHKDLADVPAEKRQALLRAWGIPV